MLGPPRNLLSMKLLISYTAFVFVFLSFLDDRRYVMSKHVGTNLYVVWKMELLRWNYCWLFVQNGSQTQLKQIHCSGVCAALILREICLKHGERPIRLFVQIWQQKFISKINLPCFGESKKFRYFLLFKGPPKKKIAK